MKQFTLFSTLLLCSLFFSSFAQTVYQTDVRTLYDWDNNIAVPDWKVSSIEQYTYDNGGNKETRILGLTPSMQNYYQHIKSYNSNNDIINDLLQSWNSISTAWEDIRQDVYTYHAGTSNIKDVTTYDFNSGHDSYKIAYEYTGSDIVKITYQVWSSSTLVNYRKYDYTYNVSGKPATEAQSDWNGAVWEQSERGVITYTSGLRELIIEKLNGSSWGLDERYLTYYTGDLETEYIQQSRVGANWVNSDRESSIYDSNDNKTDYIWDSWLSNAWSPYYKEERTFSIAAPLLSTETFDAINFKVYPNPVADILHIASSETINKMEMFNVLGERISQTFNTKQLNVEHLKSGIYLLKVFSNNRSATKKIIIK